MQQDAVSYPVRFSGEYPDRPLNRLTTFLRLVVAIPILVVLASVGGAELAGGAAGLLVLAPLLMIVFRRKYPRWWFDWSRELMRFCNRVGAYLGLRAERSVPRASGG